MPVIGVDVSKYEVSYVTNIKGEITKIRDWWSPDKSQNKIDFVIQRTSYGGKQDEQFNFLITEVLKVPIRGAYHYYNSGVKWQTQLDTILNAARDKPYHFYAVDYERKYNNLNATTFAEMMELTKQLKKATGRRVLNYFNNDVYDAFMRPYNVEAVIDTLDVWIAWYPSNIDAHNSPLLPKGVHDWRFWQFGGGDRPNTAGYNAGSSYGSWRRGIDLDLWNGSLDDLKRWAGVENEDVPVPVPTPVDERLIRLDEIDRMMAYLIDRMESL